MNDDPSSSVNYDPAIEIALQKFASAGKAIEIRLLLKKKKGRSRKEEIEGEKERETHRLG